MLFFEDRTVFEKETIVLVVVSICLRASLRGGGTETYPCGADALFQSREKCSDANLRAWSALRMGQWGRGVQSAYIG